MKRIGWIAAVLCLMLALNMTAAASEEQQNKFDQVGLSIAFPQEIRETKGMIMPYPLGAIDSDHHVYVMAFLYEAMPKEEAEAIVQSEDPSEEDVQAVTDVQGGIGAIISADVDLDTAKEAYDAVLSYVFPLDYDGGQETGTADGFTFWFFPSVTDEDYLSSIEEEYAGELQMLMSAFPEALKAADYYEPVDAIKEMTGQKIEFTTTDLDGNTVTSEELFSENEITMINCWGVWCPNCVTEMAELAEIHTRIQEKGCGVVGLEWEKEDGEEIYQEAREKMEEWGTNYPNVLMPDDLLESLSGFPTTIFVDREGVVLCTPIAGAAVSKYESTLDSLLAGEEVVPETETEAGEAAAVVYRVNVTDEDGPVEEVTIQFCDDTSCRFGDTDENGTVFFEAPAGIYEVHVMEVPDGYMEDEEVYQTTGDSDEVNIVLEKE